MHDEHGADIAGGEVVAIQGDDARRALVYLIVRDAEQYIAIMEVLEGSITDMTPREVASALAARGKGLDDSVVEARLEQLRTWGAVSATNDSSRILRYADLLARNWRYTATPTGRHVQRFYRTILAGTQVVREIPLASLRRVVDTVSSLLQGGQTTPDAELVARLFVSHDDLDGALVGAEDSLAGLANRFDLDRESTAELKTLLVGYATRVAAELERGSAITYRSLLALRPRFAELAATAVQASDARALIERGALTASRGGRVADWEGLIAWFDPYSGRGTRFALRLVRALPGMHVNLRRFHTSSGAATSRSRALTLAKACRDPAYGTAIFLAALGDHSWRKLYGAADDAELLRNPSWRGGPVIEVPGLLRSTGRGGARGRASAARDDTEARTAVAAARERRAREHNEGLREILSAPPGTPLSERAARIALASLTAAARAAAREGRRTATADGLSCTLFYVTSRHDAILAPSWRIITPGRTAVFHRPAATPRAPGIPASDEPRADASAVVLMEATR